MGIDWRRAATGGYCALLPTGERLFITPRAFGSGTYRLRGDGVIGQVLFTKQFYPSLKSAKQAAFDEYKNGQK